MKIMHKEKTFRALVNAQRALPRIQHTISSFNKRHAQRKLLGNLFIECDLGCEEMRISNVRLPKYFV
jgi:hypothetical protein